VVGEESLFSGKRKRANCPGQSPIRPGRRMKSSVQERCWSNRGNAPWLAAILICCRIILSQGGGSLAYILLNHFLQGVRVSLFRSATVGRSRIHSGILSKLQ
jgi:hypothetical protein